MDSETKIHSYLLKEMLNFIWLVALRWRSNGQIMIVSDFKTPRVNMIASDTTEKSNLHIIYGSRLPDSVLRVAYGKFVPLISKLVSPQKVYS